MHAMDLLPGIEINQSASYNSSLYSTVQNLDCGQNSCVYYESVAMFWVLNIFWLDNFLPHCQYTGWNINTYLAVYLYLLLLHTMIFSVVALLYWHTSAAFGTDELWFMSIDPQALIWLWEKQKDTE